jgi:hypothetical protein
MQPFAVAIFAKANALENRALEPSHKSRLRESISDDIKKASNLLPHKMSKRAHKAASQLQPPVDLRKKTWHEQHSFDPGREFFLVEHRNTVSSLRERCLAQKDVEGVLGVLSEIDVVWILRAEDEKLTELKYRSRRPPTAYAEASIEIWEDE